MSDNNQVTIWHNPRCSKSRLTLKLLRDRGYEPTIFRYLDVRLTWQMVEDVLAKLEMEPQDLMRKKESLYKDLRLAGQTDREELVRALAHNPKLIERPIVLVGEKAVIGRPPENVFSIL